MSTEIAFKCDGCGCTVSWADKDTMVHVEIKKNYTTILRRDYCTKCWKSREARSLEALAGEQKVVFKDGFDMESK